MSFIFSFIWWHDLQSGTIILPQSTRRHDVTNVTNSDKFDSLSLRSWLSTHSSIFYVPSLSFAMWSSSPSSTWWRLQRNLWGRCCREGWVQALRKPVWSLCQNMAIETSVRPPLVTTQKRHSWRVHVSDNDSIWKLFVRLSSWRKKTDSRLDEKSPGNKCHVLYQKETRLWIRFKNRLIPRSISRPWYIQLRLLFCTI